MNLIGTALRRINRKNDELNILAIPTHESHNTIFCNSFPYSNWYLLYLDGFKTWDRRFRSLPENCHLLKNGSIPLELNFDIILSQNVDQFQVLSPLAERYKIPLISVCHTAKYPGMSKAYLRKLKENRGDLNVFITRSSMNEWGWSNLEDGIVIEHAIDSELFKPNSEIERLPYILSVCNQFSKPQRWECCGFKLWEQVIRGNGEPNQILPWHSLGADDEPFAKPAESLDDLIFNYNKAQIFINTSLISPIPMSLIESAAMGCGIVTTGTNDIPNVFKNGHDCLMSNDPKDLRKFCIHLLSNPEEAKRLGENARKTVQERFTIQKFTKAWQNVFDKALELKL